MDTLVKKWLKSDKITEHLWNFAQDYEKEFWLKDCDLTLDKAKVMPYVCFNGAEYIAKLFETDPAEWPNLKYSVEEDSPTTPMELDHNIKNGVYLFYLDTSGESHAFVMSVKDDKLTIYNSYGGIEGFFFKEFNKRKWINTFKSFWDLTIDEQKKFITNCGASSLFISLKDYSKNVLILIV